MKGKIVLIGSYVALLTSCVSHLHNHKILECKNVVIAVEKEKEPSKFYIESLVRPIDFEQLQAITKEAIAEKEIEYATYFYTEKVYDKKEKAYFLLNNKSSYIDKSPARNKNDSVSNYKLNILVPYGTPVKRVVCSILLNHERPHIRSPGYYI